MRIFSVDGLGVQQGAADTLSRPGGTMGRE